MWKNSHTFVYQPTFVGLYPTDKGCITASLDIVSQPDQNTLFPQK